MFRLHAAVAATCLGAALFASAAYAQTTTTQQPMTSVLAGKKFTPPIKGEAIVEFTQPVTKRDPKTNMVTTKIMVRNASNAPIPRLTIDETWFDKGGALVTGGKGVINGLLQPGEVKTVEIQTPYNAKMNSNSWNFSHANGTVKPKKVKSLEEAGKEPAAKNASATPVKPVKKP